MKDFKYLWSLILIAITVPSLATAQRPWDGIEDGAPEGVSVRVHEQFYDVQGDEPAAVADDLRRQAVSAWGKPALAATIGDIRWPYRFARQGATCALSNIGIRLNATVRMPRWRGWDEAAPIEQQAWDEFLRDLREHEMGHIRLYLGASRAILEEMRTLGPVTCAQLGERVDEAANGVIVRYHDRHTAFDGDPASPRAVWPPAPSFDSSSGSSPFPSR